VTAPGRFIVFEGLDGAGTTTQSQLLADALRAKGRTVHLAHQPSGGCVGLLIRQILAGRTATQKADGKLDVVDERVMALLFAADRLDHLTSQIEPRLARGEDVILDRYVLSSLAYQGATVSHEFIQAANRYARKPDLTLFLYAPAPVALERVRKRGAKLERYETAAQMQQIEREYSRLVGTLASVVPIDGTRGIPEVAALCLAAVHEQLGNLATPG
jgi:dTMP kinase